MMAFSYYGRLVRQSQAFASCTPRGPLRHGYTTTAKAMAIRRVSADEMISETAKSEGGSGKGSESAEMQSQVAKERNFEHAAQEVVGKMEKDPESVTSEVSKPRLLLVFRC